VWLGRVPIVVAAMLTGCSHGAPRPTGDPGVSGDAGAVIDGGAAVDGGAVAVAPAAPLDAATPVDAAPSGPWDWAGVRAAEGRWRRSPECDYQPPCPVWLLAAKIVSAQRGGGRTRVIIDLGADDHVVVGMLGRLVAADGRPDTARFAVTDLAARQAWAEAPGDVGVGTGRLLLWNPTVHAMPEEP